MLIFLFHLEKGLTCRFRNWGVMGNQMGDYKGEIMKLLKKALNLTKKQSARQRTVKFVKLLLAPKRTFYGRKLTNEERFIKPILKKIDKKHKKTINRLIRKYQSKFAKPLQSGIKLVRS